MLNIHIIVLGKLKESYWREAEAEYLKRLQPYAKINIHELREESFDEKSNVVVVKQKEATKIKSELEKIKNTHIIALDEHGKQLSSVDFAKQFNNLTMEQFNNGTFVVGGPLGLDKSIVELSTLTLSLSPFTFTHQMARVILLEQIYRSAMINAGRRYYNL